MDLIVWFFMPWVFAVILLVIILICVSVFRKKKQKDSKPISKIIAEDNVQSSVILNEEQCTKQLENNRKAEIKEVSENSDKLGFTFSVLVLAVAVLCFFGALICAVLALAGDSGLWLYAGICLGCSVALVFYYWMITIFSKIYTTLVSIDKKLDDLYDK